MSTHNICCHEEIRKYEYYSVGKSVLVDAIRKRAQCKQNERSACLPQQLHHGLYCSQRDLDFR